MKNKLVCPFKSQSNITANGTATSPPTHIIASTTNIYMASDTSPSSMATPIKDTSTKDSCTDKEPTAGNTDSSMKDSSHSIAPLEKENSPGLMEAITTEMLSMEREKETDNTIALRMAQPIKDNGSMGSKKVKEFSLSAILQCMKASSRKG